MDQGKRATAVKDEKVDVLRLQEFVRKLGGIEKAKLALDELARLKKPA